MVHVSIRACVVCYDVCGRAVKLYAWNGILFHRSQKAVGHLKKEERRNNNKKNIKDDDDDGDVRV